MSREDEFLNRVAEFVRSLSVPETDDNAKRHNAAIQFVAANILDSNFNRPLVQAAWDFTVGGSNSRNASA